MLIMPHWAEAVERVCISSLPLPLPVKEKSPTPPLPLPVKERLGRSSWAGAYHAPPTTLLGRRQVASDTVGRSQVILGRSQAILGRSQVILGRSQVIEEVASDSQVASENMGRPPGAASGSRREFQTA